MEFHAKTELNQEGRLEAATVNVKRVTLDSIANIRKFVGLEAMGILVKMVERHREPLAIAFVFVHQAGLETTAKIQLVIHVQQDQEAVNAKTMVNLLAYQEIVIVTAF